MCKVLNVSKSGSYDSLRATPSPRTQRSFAIRAAVRLKHEESHGIYGSQKIAEVMKQDDRMENRRPDGGQLLHPSDQGCQYMSDTYQLLLKSLKITCSMSHKGCCYDNAVAERLFWSLKNESTNFEA